MKSIRPLLLGIFALVPLASFGSEQIYVQVPAVVDRSASIPPAIRSECGLEQLVGNYALKGINKRFSSATPWTPGSKVGSSKLVKVTVVSAQGVGGGAWTGPKTMTVRADLVKNDKLIKSTVIQRHSMGGPLGAVRGTCAIMERIAVTLGDDVSLWLSTVVPADSAEGSNK